MPRRVIRKNMIARPNAFSRRSFLLAAGAAGLAGCTAVGGPAAGGRANRTTVPGTLRYTDGEGISSLNDHITPQLSVGFLADLHQGFLCRYDERDRPYADLATELPSHANGGISADGKTIVFRLRRGLKWSDGAPFTPDDVVFTTQAMQNPANGDLYRSALDAVVDAGRRGEDEVVFRLKRPFAPFTDQLFSSDSSCILPKHLLGSLPNITHAAYNAMPIGLGPFSVRRWARDEDVTLMANPDYHLGRPKLDRIVYKIVRDWNTIVNEIRTGALDFAAFVPAAQYLQGKDVPGYHGVSVPGGTFSQLSFNLKHPPVDDVAVRRALRLATNRRALAGKVMHGLADLQESPVGAQSPHADARIPFREFDLARAAAMLEGAGWHLGSDGTRAKGSQRLELTLAMTTGNSERDAIADLVQSDWKKIGVDLSVNHYPATTLYDSYAADGILMHGRFDVELSHQGYGIYGDESTIFSCRSQPPAGNDVDRYCSPAFDRAMDAFDAEYDAAAAQRDADAFQLDLADDVPTIVLFIARDLYVVSDDFKNFSPRGTFDGSETWSI